MSIEKLQPDNSFITLSIDTSDLGQDTSTVPSSRATAKKALSKRQTKAYLKVKELVRFFTILWIFLSAVHLDSNAQNLLRYFDADTEVSKISFRFEKGVTPTFAADELKEQIVTQAPTFWNRLDRFNPFKKSRPFPFDPIELQKDVVRLRQFYNQNGFPQPGISYATSRLDTTENKIHIRLAIQEGPPLFIEEILFLDTEGNTLQVAPEDRESWSKFAESVKRSAGTRYTDVERLRIQDQIYAWFQNQGYAFVEVTVDPTINDSQREAILKLYVDTGPVGYISSVQIEGNESVSENVLMRELPFEVGDRFSSRKLREGQQELFGLNLFRVALADLPPQDPDSTVDVRIRVNEARPRFVTAETGYSLQDGIGIEGEWTNRNFFGSARNLSVNLIAHTGILGSTGRLNEENVIGKLPARRFRTTVSLKQPYLFTTKLSSIMSPFIEFQNDPQLLASNDFLDINRREYGFGTTLIYELYPFRPISVQYTFSRLLSRSSGAQLTGLLARDLYNKSTLRLSGTFGKADNYISPNSGFLFKPFFESAGRLFASGLQYTKVGLEFVNYLPVSSTINFSNRLFYGELWPLDESKQALAGRSCSVETILTATSTETEQCLIYENRFDPVFFYAGGGSDVRGWTFQLLGPKVPRADTVFTADGSVSLDANGNPEFDNFVFERIGGTTKLIGNFEMRRKLPGWGSEWEAAAFFDFGQISNNGIRFKDFHYAIGGGIRYNTFIGVIRADIAMKLNPSTSDLVTPEDAFLFVQGRTSSVDKRFFRRFGLHLSIGQAF